MKKKAKNDGNLFLFQWGIATVILLVFVFGTLIDYNDAMLSGAKTRAIEKVTKQTLEIKGYYEGKYTSAMNTAKAAAAFCVNQEDLTGEASVEYLNSVVEANGYLNGYIVMPDGKAVDNKGMEYVQLDGGDKLNELLEGGIPILPKKNENGVTMLMFSAPIRTSTKLLGYVLFSTQSSYMKSLIEIPIYSYSIIYNDGTVMETLGNYNICKNGENIIDTVHGMAFLEGSYATFTQGIATGRSVSARVQKGQEESFYLVSQPINGTNSEIIVCVRGKQIERTTADENESTKNLIYKLTISLIIFVTFLALIYIISKIAFAKTSRELQNQAETDLLTDLLNKMTTERKIKEYLEGEGRNKVNMMCVLDIDNFKKINDTMGHAFGDEVLASLGKQIRSEFRVSDIIGRTGGDEFIIFLKDLKDAETIEKEANRVAGFFKTFTVGEYTKYSATASIGAALYPNDGKDYEALYKAADTALYKAKNRGKNQLAFYNENKSNQ